MTLRKVQRRPETMETYDFHKEAKMPPILYNTMINTYILTYKTKLTLKDRLFKIVGIGRRRRRIFSKSMNKNNFKQYFRIPKEANTLEYFY